MRFKSGNLDPANEPRGYPVNKIDDELKAIVQASARSSKICLKLTVTVVSARLLASAFDVSLEAISDHLRQVGKIK